MNSTQHNTIQDLSPKTSYAHFVSSCAALCH